MKKNEEIHKNIVNHRYYYSLLLVFLIVLNQFANFANTIVIVSIFAFLLAILLLNKKTTPENMGVIVIFQMVSMVGMIGVYDYFSASHDRLNFFLNFATGFSCGLSVYGLYFGVRENR